MTRLIHLYHFVFEPLARADWLLPTLARFLFAAVLAAYFWVSALTKLGDGVWGIFKPTIGAYAQIFPETMEALGYETSALGLGHWAIAVLATSAEFLFPLLIILGLATRLASLGMIIFVFVQSLTDLHGHNRWGDGFVQGAWFDAPSNSLIMDQRALWIFLLLVLVAKGAGPISVDRIFTPNKPASAH